MPRKKLPVMDARPATRAPINAVTRISSKGLSAFRINKETLCAKMFSFCELIQNAEAPHNMNNAVKPARKAIPARKGITTATKKAMMAILHQGKNKQATKLSSIIKIMLEITLIELNYFILY